MKTILIARTQRYNVTAIRREQGDPKSVSNAVRILVGNEKTSSSEVDLAESQALNLVDALEKAVEKLRDS